MLPKLRESPVPGGLGREGAPPAPGRAPLCFLHLFHVQRFQQRPGRAPRPHPHCSAPLEARGITELQSAPASARAPPTCLSCSDPLSPPHPFTPLLQVFPASLSLVFSGGFNAVKTSAGEWGDATEPLENKGGYQGLIKKGRTPRTSRRRPSKRAVPPQLEHIKHIFFHIKCREGKTRVHNWEIIKGSKSIKANAIGNTIKQRAGRTQKEGGWRELCR